MGTFDGSNHNERITNHNFGTQKSCRGNVRATSKKSRDEVCPKHACNWKSAEMEGTKCLSREVREPEKLFVHMFVVLKITENGNDLNIPQGTQCGD